MPEVIDKGASSAVHPVPILFVHGGAHAAWCWDDHFLDYFAENGFRALAVSRGAFDRRAGCPEIPRTGDDTGCGPDGFGTAQRGGRRDAWSPAPSMMAVSRPVP